MKDEDACKGFEAIKVKNRRHNTADEIPDCGSENLRQLYGWMDDFLLQEAAPSGPLIRAESYITKHSASL